MERQTACKEKDGETSELHHIFGDVGEISIMFESFADLARSSLQQLRNLRRIRIR